MKKVSAIIINYNTIDVLRDCLSNLKGKYENLEVIVVDNASSDGSSDMVEREFNWVKLVKMAENKGLAFASNVGFEVSSGDYLLYLGSDAFPDTDTIGGMVSYMDSHADVGIATCKLVLRDGTLDEDAHRGFPTPWAAVTHFSKLNRKFPKSKFLNRYFMGYENFDNPHEIDMCISHFMLIRREVLISVGKWDTDYFLYGEDVDLCFKVKESGYKIMYLPQWRAVHYKGTGIGIRKSSQDVSKASLATKKKAALERARAQRIFYMKHYKTKYPKIVTYGVLVGMDVFNKLRNRLI